MKYLSQELDEPQNTRFWRRRGWRFDLSWDQQTEKCPRSKSVFYCSFPPNVVCNWGNLVVLVQKTVQRKLEIRQPMLLSWIIKMG